MLIYTEDVLSIWLFIFCRSVVSKFWPSASGRPLTAQLICAFGCIKVVCNISVCRGSLKGLNVETANHLRKLLLTRNHFCHEHYKRVS